MRLSIQDILAASLAESTDLVTELVVTNRGVHDLGDVELLANLQHLNCAFNAIKSLKALEKLEKLLVVNLMHNQVKALNSVARCSALQVLKVSNNGVRSLAPLASCSQLEELWVQQNAVESMDELAHLSKLARVTRLGFHPNPCTKDLAPHVYRAAALAHVPALQFLDGRPVTMEEQAAASLTSASMAARSRPIPTSSPSSSAGPASPSFAPGSPSSLPGSPVMGSKEGGSKGGSPAGRVGPGSGLHRSRLVANRMGRSKNHSFPSATGGGPAPSLGSPNKPGFHRLASLAPEAPSYSPAANGSVDPDGNDVGGDVARSASNGAMPDELGVGGFLPRSAPVHGRRSVMGGALLAEQEEEGASTTTRSSSALAGGHGSFLSTIMDMLPSFTSSSPAFSSDSGTLPSLEAGGKVAAGRRGAGLGGASSARPKLSLGGSSSSNNSGGTSGGQPGEYVCKYEAGAGKGLAAVTVRSDGSATAKWPNNALAVSINREVRGGAAGYRLLACFRGSEQIAMSFDPGGGGFVYYPSGSLAFSYSAETGAATQFTREGGIAADLKLTGGPAGGAKASSQGGEQPPLDILVDAHFGFRFLPSTRTKLVYFCCGDVQHVFVQGFNELRPVWEIVSTASAAKPPACNGEVVGSLPDASRNGNDAMGGLNLLPNATGQHTDAPSIGPGGMSLHASGGGLRDDQGGVAVPSESTSRRASAIGALTHVIRLCASRGSEGDPAGEPPPAFLSKLLQTGGGAEGRSKRGELAVEREDGMPGAPPRTLDERLGDIRSVTSALDALDKDLNSWLKGKIK